MKKYYLFAFFAFVTLFYISCKCKEYVNCENGVLYLSTISFSKADLDSASFLTYKADNRFDSLIDSFKDLDAGYYYSVSDTDTFRLSVGAAVGRDYKVVFPTLNKVYLITNLSYTGSTTQEINVPCGTDQAYCYNNVNFDVNGQRGNPNIDIYYFSK